MRSEKAKREVKGAEMAVHKKEHESEESRRAAAPNKEDSWMSY